MIALVLGARSSASIEVDTVSDDKDERAMEVQRRLATADADAADDPEMFRARLLRGSYVRFGRSLPSRELGEQNDDGKTASADEQQKRSKHYVRFGRSPPVDVDEYFYDDAPVNGDDDDDVLQSFDFISRRNPRRHYVRFGRSDVGSGRHYIRFGRNAAGTDGGAAAAADKRPSRHYVRFGRDASRRQIGDDAAAKRVHYVRFGRAGELGLRDAVDDGDSDRATKADKRPNYVRFG